MSNSESHNLAKKFNEILQELSQKLLNWYDKHHRTLPWRISPIDGKLGVLPDPYHVWLSEIMLQQTTVIAVTPYFEKFLKLWPSVKDMAGATEDEIMQAWAGLGYYSRARNLKKCADTIAADHGGMFPETEDALLKLPGIGPYTAAAIAAIAFQKPCIVIDGNIERVFTRLYEISTPLPKAKPEIKDKIALHLNQERPGDFAQALMDLGSSICTPKKPACLHCPLQAECQSCRNGTQENFPVKLPKKKKPKRGGAAFVIENASGAIFLQKRPDTGLLANMAQVPTTDWNSNQDGETNVDFAPIALSWVKKGSIKHVFTHFELTLYVYHALTDDDLNLDGWWSNPQEIEGEALPNLMRKVLAQAKD